MKRNQLINVFLDQHCSNNFIALCVIKCDDINEKTDSQFTGNVVYQLVREPDFDTYNK